MNRRKILNGTDYPAKAGMLAAEAIYLRNSLDLLIKRVRTQNELIKSPILEGMCDCYESVLDNTKYLVEDR